MTGIARKNLMTGAVVAVLVVILVAVSQTYGTSDNRWCSGYETGFTEGWRAAYQHIADGDESL